MKREQRRAFRRDLQRRKSVIKVNERTARIYNITPETAERYLPGNYEVRTQEGNDVIIAGSDQAGWTLDGYVIPRLASGNYRCIEEPAPIRMTVEEYDELQRLVREIHSTAQNMSDYLAAGFPYVPTDENSGLWEYLGVVAGNAAAINEKVYGQGGPIS